MNLYLLFTSIILYIFCAIYAFLPSYYDTCYINVLLQKEYYLAILFGVSSIIYFHLALYDHYKCQQYRLEKWRSLELCWTISSCGVYTSFIVGINNIISLILMMILLFFLGMSLFFYKVMKRLTILTLISVTFSMIIYHFVYYELYVHTDICLMLSGYLTGLIYLIIIELYMSSNESGKKYYLNLISFYIKLCVIQTQLPHDGF